jgi:hypothetical protein
MVLAGKDNYGEPPDPVELRKAAFWEKTVQQPKSEAQLRVFLDECLRGTNDIVRSFFSGRLSSEELPNEYNPQIIDRFYKESIIIKQSPPSGIPFGQLAKSASSASIGALVGYYGQHEPMLFLTIPAGIVLVRSAVAVSKAIDQGIHFAIDRFLKRKSAGRRNK